ncbi:transketolase [Alteribacillus sp. YIM 98480]|uniref:transketolase n=1 Tax=Alteribacillus sp. YIM 98480 TaxID=2606599 RepID=UPI00131BE68B|nr:transketolase [Alteribacillus sp. YIM 98480]
MTFHNTKDQQVIDTIRMLSIDAVEKANSGHPGMPMGAAPMAWVLFSKYLKMNPQDPDWRDRDRFVLSAGHGSMLQYSLLHLFDYDISMEDLKTFRQLNSKTPGHPEYGHTAGVEATTGPLGQGIAMTVGMAMAEAHQSAVFNKNDHELVDHFTYAICGDGDLMEGVSHEAASLAGHLGLGKLIWMYDSNDISLDGDLHQSFSEDVQKRFESYGWQVLYVEDGNDVDAIDRAIQEARNNKNQPSLIEVKTVIGFGSPNKGGTSQAHGAPLGKEEIGKVKEAYGWTEDTSFFVSEDVRSYVKEIVERKKREYAQCKEREEMFKTSFAEAYDAFEQGYMSIPQSVWENIEAAVDLSKDQATRASSGDVIQAAASNVTSFIGGAADLASSNKTAIKNEQDFLKGQYEGRNIWFGVREFAMGAALNGMALHGGLYVYGGTFLTFSDYMRSSIRSAALMNLPVTYVFTHDSIFVGEDGPTHQPIEHLASLRAMPNVRVIRPADVKETYAAWKQALTSGNRPTVLALSRQGLPALDLSVDEAAAGVEHGAYVVKDHPEADLLLLATGSEVSLALNVQAQLEKEGYKAKVISMPSWENFDAESREYKQKVLDPTITKRVAIEMASPLGWEKYTGTDGLIVGMDTFGISAPGPEAAEYYGFTVENIIKKIKQEYALEEA